MRTSPDRPPLASDNPRHAVWIEDEAGLRTITATTPGAQELRVGDVTYRHTRDLRVNGPWVYTKYPPET